MGVEPAPTDDVTGAVLPAAPDGTPAVPRAVPGPPRPTPGPPRGTAGPADVPREGDGRAPVSVPQEDGGQPSEDGLDDRSGTAVGGSMGDRVADVERLALADRADAFAALHDELRTRLERGGDGRG